MDGVNVVTHDARIPLAPCGAPPAPPPPPGDHGSGVTAEDPHDHEEFTTFFDIKAFAIMKGDREFDEGEFPGAGAARQRQDGGFA
jgi:hypothetical protein